MNSKEIQLSPQEADENELTGERAYLAAAAIMLLLLNREVATTGHWSLRPPQWDKPTSRSCEFAGCTPRKSVCLTLPKWTRTACLSGIFPATRELSGMDGVVCCTCPSDVQSIGGVPLNATTAAAAAASDALWMLGAYLISFLRGVSINYRFIIPASHQTGGSSPHPPLLLCVSNLSCTGPLSVAGGTLIGWLSLQCQHTR